MMGTTAFCHVAVAARSTLQGEIFVLSHGFCPWPLGPVAFGPVTRQHVMAGKCHGDSYSSHGSQGANRDRKGIYVPTVLVGTPLPPMFLGVPSRPCL